MAYRDMPDCIVPPSHERCEAMTKPLVPSETYQVWRREPHRCVRRAKQGRDGRSVCSLHARVEKVSYCTQDADAFRHKKFWKWPRKLAELATVERLEAVK